MTPQELEKLLNEYNAVNSTPVNPPAPTMPDEEHNKMLDYGAFINRIANTPPTPDNGMAESLSARANVPVSTPPPAAAAAPKRALAAQPASQPSSEEVDTAIGQRKPITHDTKEELLAAQEAARNNVLSANLLNAGQGINEALNRTKFDRIVPDALTKTANMPVEQYKERQAGAKSDLDILQEMYKQSTNEMLADPTSPISQASTSLLKKMGIDLKGVSALDIENSPVLSKLMGFVESAGARKEAARMHQENLQESRADRKDRNDRLDAEKADTKKEKGITGVSTRLEKAGLSEIDPVINNILKDIDLNSSDPIPGVGPIESGLHPALLLNEPEKAKRIRESLAQLQNIILKARSGQAVTESEANRMLKEIGLAPGRTEQELRQGITNTINTLSAKKKGILAGYKPDVLSEYSNRGGNIEELGGKPAAVQAPVSDASKEEKRFVHSGEHAGKTAIYDRETKKFLRFE